MDASALANAESWLTLLNGAKLVAAFLVAIGVAIEFGADFAARPYEKVVKDAKDLQLKSLENEASSAKAALVDAQEKIVSAGLKIADAERHTGEAKAEAAQSLERATDAQSKIAEANERTAKTELELAKFKAARVLTGEQRASISKALHSFSGQKYDLILPRMMEPGSTLHTQLIFALQQAGWKLQSVQTGPRRKITIAEAIGAVEIPSVRAEGASKFVMPDIEIGISDGWIGINVCFELGDVMAPQGIEPHDALVKALREAGVDANLQSLSEEKLGLRSFPPKTGPTVVHIIIGSKN